MPTLTIQELKEHDPHRFEREYHKWLEYCCDHDWWDMIEEEFKAEMETLGGHVDSIYFSLSYSQGDYAAFNGRVTMHKFMEHQGYKDKYLALWYDFLNDGTVATVKSGLRGYYARVDFSHYVGNTLPDGPFEQLPQDAWDELVGDQYDAEDWEKLVREWVRDRCDTLYRRLRDEYESLTTEEEFIASCEANEVAFEVEEEV